MAAEEVLNDLSRRYSGQFPVDVFQAGAGTSFNININEANMSKIKSIGMAEARPKLTQLVEEVNSNGEPYLIVSGSKVKAVLIGIDRFYDLMDSAPQAALIRLWTDQTMHIAAIAAWVAFAPH